MYDDWFSSTWRSRGKMKLRAALKAKCMYPVTWKARKYQAHQGLERGEENMIIMVLACSWVGLVVIPGNSLKNSLKSQFRIHILTYSTFCRQNAKGVSWFVGSDDWAESWGTSRPGSLRPMTMWSPKNEWDQVCKDGALLNPLLWSGSSQQHIDASYLKVHLIEPVVLGLPVQSCVVWHFNQTF